MMSKLELHELADDIRENGLLESVVLYDDMVIDGRNRLVACSIAGVQPTFVTENIESPTHYVISKNLHRRHLTTSQRGAIAAEAMDTLRAEAKERMRAGGGDRVSETARAGMPKSTYPVTPIPINEIKGPVRDIAAKALGVSGYVVGRAAQVRQADPEEFERVKRGEITVGAAFTAPDNCRIASRKAS